MVDGSFMAAGFPSTMYTKSSPGIELRRGSEAGGPLPDLASGWLESDAHFKVTESFKYGLSQNVGQSLTSILNNPHQKGNLIQPSDSSWVGWMMSPVTAVTGTASSETLYDGSPLLSACPLPEVPALAFQEYLKSIAEPYQRFLDVREHTKREGVEDSERSQEQSSIHSEEGSSSTDFKANHQGEGLIICLREVPPLYFNEDFALEKATTFQQACPIASIPANMLLQEKLSHYLDLVEQHLVREIAARSESFCDALSTLEDLYSQVSEACGQVAELKKSVHGMDGALTASVLSLQQLNRERENLLATHHKLKLVACISHAQATARLLLSSGDCVGALDVIDDTRKMLEQDELVGLQCFRRFEEEMMVSLDLVSTVMAADFVRLAAYVTPYQSGAAAVAKAQQVELDLTDPQVEDKELAGQEVATLQEQLFPLVIGLFRMSKLAAVLRSYRDSLVTDIKAAIKGVVNDMLQVVWQRPGPAEGEMDVSSGGDPDGGGLSLAYRLRGLTPENFVKLLAAVFDTVQARLGRAVEVRNTVEEIVKGLDGVGAASATTAEVVQENSEAVCAACDAANGRWAKLLGVRVLVHPHLTLPQYLAIYNATQAFVAATEKIAGRPGYSIRGTLQSQSKALVDAQHSSKLKALVASLEAETWVAVDAHPEYQEMVKRLVGPDSSSSEASSAALERAPSQDEQSVEPAHPEASIATANGSTAEANGQLESSISIERNGSTADDEAPASTAAEDEQPLDSGASRASSGETAEAALQQEQKPAILAEGGKPIEAAKGKKAAVKTLFVRGVRYHAVKSALLLLSLLLDYLAMITSLPTVSNEVVHRVAEILKVFNSRTCQLVLGAGALQVSGLKSITAKHLATASQCVSLFIALTPDIQRQLGACLPESHRKLLLSEFDRVVQDLTVHRDEVHSKLVAIMRERLQVHLKSLPALTEEWWKADEADADPSTFARALIKEVGVLLRVLSSLLNEQDLQSIFTRVVLLFHQQLAEAYSRVDIKTSPAKRRLQRDLRYVLDGLAKLPVSPVLEGKPKELDRLLQQRFGNEPPP